MMFDYTLDQLQKILDSAMEIDDSSGYRLDQEIKNHSKVHKDWVFLAAKARKLASLAEMELKSITAELATKIRAEAEATGKALAKTSPVEKEMVPTRPEWKEAYRYMIEMNEYSDVLSAVERVFQNRSRLLDVLGRRQMYFDPSVKQSRQPKVSIDDELVEMKFEG